MKILFLSGEVTPFSGSGKQGDLVSVLAPALKRVGHEVRVVTPRYDGIRERKYGLREVTRLTDLNFTIGDSEFAASIKSGFIPCSKVQTYFIDNPSLDPESPVRTSMWKNPYLTAPQLIHGGLQLTTHLNWLPDIIFCNGLQLALAPAVIRTDPMYRDRLSAARIILQFFSDQSDLKFERIALNYYGFGKKKLPRSSTAVEFARNYADAIIDSRGTTGEWLEFLTQGDSAPCEMDPAILTKSETTNGNLEPKISLKAEIQSRLGLSIDPSLPLVALYSEGEKIEDTLRMLEAELPMLEAQLIALGGCDSVRAKTELWSNRHKGKVVAIQKGPDDTLRHIAQAADILFIPHADRNKNMFNYCRNFPDAVPLITEDLFATNGNLSNYHIPNYAHCNVFPSGDSRAMIEALRKTTETYKNPLNWNELVQKGINRELCCEYVARNMAEEFFQLLESPLATA